MTSKPDISLIIPTLNERENIEPLIQQVEAALNGFSFEIIIADDNSSDGTAEVVSELSRTKPHIRLLKRVEKKGLSAAVVDGFKAGNGEILAVMDADLSHDASLLPKMVSAIREGKDMAVGSRRVKGGGADHWPWFRRLYSHFATQVAIFLFNLPILDPLSGYFAFRRNVFERIQGSLDPMGYKILLEVLLRGQITSVVEIPFIFIDRKQGYSKLGFKVATQYFLMLWRLRPYIWMFHLLRKTYHEGRYRIVKGFVKDGRLLDIGCGQPCETMPDQSFLRFMDRPGSVGLDIKRVEGPYEFHQGSIEAIPFPNESFDNVVAMEVLEHIHHWEKALSEIKRILKPGGVLVMSTPDTSWFWEKMWNLWTKSVGQMWDEAHVAELKVSDWIQILQKEFELKKVKRYWGVDVIYHCVKK